MELKSGKLRGYQVFDVVGDFADDAAHELREILQAMPADKPPKVLVSLHSAKTVNSFGISILIWAWKWAAEKNGKLYIIGRPDLVQKLKVMNLENIIKMFASEEEFIENVFGQASREIDTSLKTQGKFRVVVIEDDLNILVDAQQLRRQLMEQVDAGHKCLALDLSKINFLYSEVLGVFIWVDKKLRAKGGELHLIGLSDDLLYIFQNAGLSKMLNLSKSKDLGG